MRQLRIAGVLTVLVCLLGETGTQASGTDRPHLDSVTRAARDTNSASRIIVRYRAGAEARVQDRLRAKRADVRLAHRNIQALTVVASGQTLRDLASDPDVLGISADAPIQAHGGKQSSWKNLLPTSDAQQLRRTLGLHGSASGGRGVGVAVIDSGIAPVVDLAGRISAFYDFTAGGVATRPSDDYGHGTHVASLIAGSGLQSLGSYPGIAADARLIGLKVLDANGAGYTSDVIAAIEFAVANRRPLGIDIINLSLGHPILEPAATDPLVQAVERASAAGIVVVTSAGNAGRIQNHHDAGFGGISSPGNAPSALTVGAVHTQQTAERGDDVVPAFSSRGPTWFDGTIKPDVLAPGVALVAATNPSSSLGRRGNASKGYIALSGTSMASAVATGVVALMIEANRLDENAKLTPNMIKMLLQYSAIAVGRASDAMQLIEGAGSINAAGAIELARVIAPATALGRHWLERGVTPATRIGGTQESWSRRVTWGDRLVAGDIITRNEQAWSAKSVWGTRVTWSADSWLTASMVLDTYDVWSSQMVRGATPVRAMDDDHIVWGNAEDSGGLSGNCTTAEDDDHIVWGNSSCGDEHIVWGSSTTPGAGAK